MRLKKQKIDSANVEKKTKLKTEALQYLASKTKVDLLRKARAQARL